MNYTNEEMSFVDRSADKTKMKTIFLELFEECPYTLIESRRRIGYEPVKKPFWFSKSGQVNNLGDRRSI